MLIQTKKHVKHVGFKHSQTPYCHKSILLNMFVCRSKINFTSHLPMARPKNKPPPFHGHNPCTVGGAKRLGEKGRQRFGANCHVACRFCVFLSLETGEVQLLAEHAVRIVLTHCTNMPSYSQNYVWFDSIFIFIFNICPKIVGWIDAFKERRCTIHCVWHGQATQEVTYLSVSSSINHPLGKGHITYIMQYIGTLYILPRYS